LRGLYKFLGGLSPPKPLPPQFTPMPVEQSYITSEIARRLGKDENNIRPTTPYTHAR